MNPSHTPAATALDLSGVIDAVQQRVNYLRASTIAPPEDGWLHCESLCGGGPDLVALITETGKGRGAEQPDVAASLFSQAYAFRVGAIPLAAFALGLAAPDPRPAVTAIAIARDRPASIALLSPTVEELEPGLLAQRLLGDHLDRFHTAVRQQFKIGERLLRGNAASSFARIFRAIESADGVDAAAVRDRANSFFAAAKTWFDGLGAFDTVTVGDQQGWFWTRTSCCLWYQASGGSMCDDCSLIKPEELAATRRELVAGAVA